MIAVLEGNANVDIVFGQAEIERVVPRDFLERRNVHQFLGDQGVAFLDRSKPVPRAELAMPLPEGAVDLGDKGAGCAIHNGDPEANRVEMEPQETWLCEQ